SRPELLGNWLYGVAGRTAREARARAAARRAREREATAMPQRDRAAEAPWDDVRPLLDEEIGRLPEKYRVALVLCYLEGKTHQEAARALGVAPGSMSWRLRRGCELLRQGLSRRGVALSAAIVTGALAGGAARAAVPVPLIGTTVDAGLRFAAGGAAAAAVPA